MDRVSYCLEIKSLPFGKYSFEYELDDTYFAKSEKFGEISGCVSVSVEISKQSSCTELIVELKGELCLACDRCLSRMSMSIDREQSMSLKLDSNGNLLNTDELELSYEDGVLDLEPLIYEEIMLAIPIKKVHDEGQCNPDMLQIFDKYSKNGDVEDRNSEIDPRWAALKNISDKLKK